MQKSQLTEAYDKYLWEKCGWSTFYKRVQRWIDVIEALKPVEKKKWHPEKVIKSRKFKDELDWYHQQEWEKCGKQRFYQRLYNWYTKEEAIKPLFWIHKSNKPINYKAGYVRQPKPIKKESLDYTEINIKYQKSEADIIKREYERMIEDLEFKWRNIDDPVEAKNIDEKLTKLKNEYEVFIKSNY